MSLPDVLASRGLASLPEPLPVPVIDSHTHLDTTAEIAHLAVADALAAAAAVGVTKVVQVGCDVAGSRFAVDLAASEPSVVATVALHPNDAARIGDDVWTAFASIEELAAAPGVRGIGETGLDYFRTRDAAGQEIQRASFAAHIALARRHDLALVIHDRDAHADILAVLDGQGVPERFVMHCFSGDAAFARACLDRGAWLSFPGTVTFKGNEALREAARLTPLDRILVETDAPFLTPAPRRGKRNASYLLPHTVRFLAALRDEPVDELCAALSANAEAVFGRWPPPANDEPAPFAGAEDQAPPHAEDQAPPHAGTRGR